MKLNDILTKPLKEILDIASVSKVDYYTNDDEDLLRINVVYQIPCEKEESSRRIRF